MPTTAHMIPTDQGGLNHADWVLSGKPTKWEAVEPANPPDFTDTARVAITRVDTRSISFGLSAAPSEMATITSVKVGSWAQNRDNYSPSQQIWYAARIGGVLGAWTVVSGQGTFGGGITRAQVDVARPGGGDWIPSDIQDVTIEVACRVNSWISGVVQVRLYDIWLEIVFEPVLSSREPSREIGSRRLWALRKADSVLPVKVPLALGADLDLLDYIPMSHFAGPHDSVPGWGTKNWQRRPMRVIEHSALPGQDIVELRLLDIRHLLCLYQDLAWTTKPTGGTADGISRFGKGLTRTFARDSQAWVDDAAGGGPVVLAENNKEKNADGGLIVEGVEVNEIIQSSFKNGSGDTFTGWTNSGEGSNGSDINEETSILLFESGESARTVKFTAGDPIHVADMQILSTATASFSADVICRASIDHYDAATDVLSYAIQRGFDSEWWRDSDQTWQAAKTWNDLTASELAWDRHISKQIDVGSDATTIAVAVGIPTATGVAAQENICGHVQIEQAKFVSSRILTEAAIKTRENDILLVSNNSTARSWNNAQGAFPCEVIPGWDAADVNTENKTVIFVGHDADNWEWLYYDGTNARWVFERKVATTIYRAIFAATPTRGTAVKIGARWTGSNGELDLTNFTASIFVDGVKGTDVVTVAAPTEADTVDIEFGNKSEAEYFDGQMRLFHSFQYVPTDLEMKRLI